MANGSGSEEDVVVRISSDAQDAVDAALRIQSEYAKVAQRIINLQESIEKNQAKLDSLKTERRKQYYRELIASNELEIKFLQQRARQAGIVGGEELTTFSRVMDAAKRLQREYEISGSIQQKNIDQASRAESEAAIQTKKVQDEIARIRDQNWAESDAAQDRYYSSQWDNIEETRKREEMQHQLILDDLESQNELATKLDVELQDKRLKLEEETSKKAQSQRDARESVMRRFATSAGFGLLASGIPGTRSLAALSIGYGFSDMAGLAGAASVVALTAIVNAAKKLIEAYTELAKKAYDLRTYQDGLDESYKKVEGDIDSVLIPTLVKVTKQETNYYEAIHANRDLINQYRGVIDGLSATMTDYAQRSVMAVTGTNNLSDGFKILGIAGERLKNIPAFAWNALTGNPMAAWGNVKGFFGSNATVMAGVPKDKLGPYQDVYRTEEERLKQLMWDREADAAKGRIQALKFEDEQILAKIGSLKKEYDLKNYILDIEKEYNAEVAKEAYRKAAGPGLPSFMSVFDVEGEQRLKMAQTMISGIKEVMEAQRKLDESRKTKNQELQNMAQLQKIYGAAYTLEPYYGEPQDVTQSRQRIHQAENNVYEAQRNLNEAKRKADDEYAKTDDERQAAMIEARRKDSALLLQLEVDYLTKKMQLDIEHAQKEMDLWRQLDAATGGATGRRVTQAYFQGAQAPGTFRFEQQPTPGLGSMFVANLPEVSPNAKKLADIESLKAIQDHIQQQIKSNSLDRDDLAIQLKQQQTDEDRARIRANIRAAKDYEVSLDTLAVENLREQQRHMEPLSDKWKEIDNQIVEIQNKITKFKPVTLTWGEQLSNTFEILAHHAGEFNATLGKATANTGRLLRGILDLKKVGLPGEKDENGNPVPAGSIGAGLKASFTGSNILTAGIPLAAGIFSAVMGIVGALRDMFSKAAKQIGEAIGKEVDKLDRTATQTGRLQDAIAGLEAERNKALTELTGRKGGQKQLDTLLPKIDAALESIKQKQLDIMYNFENMIDHLGLPENLEPLYDKILAIHRAVEEYIKAMGESPETFARAQEFVNRSMARVKGQIQKNIDDENEAWLHGQENVRGELISATEKEAQDLDDIEKNYHKASIDRAKRRADLIKAYDKQEQADLQKIADLKQQLLDLDDAERKNILLILNEGIQERTKTTQQDKAQRIADLQDENSKRRKAINDELGAIAEARTERATAHKEAIDALDEEERLAKENYNNDTQRVINHYNRAKELHDKKIKDLKEEYDWITANGQAELDWIDTLIAAWTRLQEARTPPPPEPNNTDNTDPLRLAGLDHATYNSTLSVGTISISISAKDVAVGADEVRNIVSEELTKVVKQIPIRR